MKDNLTQTRRSFLKTAGAVGAGLMVLPSCTMPTDETQKNIGLQLYTLRDFLPTDTANTLEKVARIGYNIVELAAYENGKIYDIPIKEFKKMLDDNGLASKSGHYLTGTHKPEAIGSMTNGWEKAIEDAEFMGQEYMVCAYLFDTERKTIATKNSIYIYSKP